MTFSCRFRLGEATSLQLRRIATVTAVVTVGGLLKEHLAQLSVYFCKLQTRPDQVGLSVNAHFQCAP